MATKVPVDRQLLFRKGLLDPERFFSLVSRRCNYIDEEIVKMVMIAMTKTISSELKQHEFVHIPYFGEFMLMDYNSGNRIAFGGSTTKRKGNLKLMMPIKDFKVVKFYMNSAWRDYMNKWQWEKKGG